MNTSTVATSNAGPSAARNAVELLDQLADGSLSPTLKQQNRLTISLFASISSSFFAFVSPITDKSITMANPNAPAVAAAVAAAVALAVAPAVAAPVVAIPCPL
jgi:hypothetical protein